MDIRLIYTFLSCLVLSQADPPGPLVRWCLKSNAELKKCQALSWRAPNLRCVLRDGPEECIEAIAVNEADAITLDGGDIYKAGLLPYNLHPIFAEDYGQDLDSCHYAVAVVRRGAGLRISELRGKKSCHSGIRKSTGWIIPISTLVSNGQISRSSIENQPEEQAVGNYFSASCVPGARRQSTLCRLCKGDCSLSDREPYYDDDGAFRCLQDGAGDVAFVNHLTVPAAVKGNYELLCLDNSVKNIDEYKTCHLGRVPANAVVGRKDPEMTARIFELLKPLQAVGLFSSLGDRHRNLMFKDSTKKLLQVPPTTNAFMYLGAQYLGLIRSLRQESRFTDPVSSMKWCSVGTAEAVKCDAWSMNSMDDHKGPGVICLRGNSVDDCLSKIMIGEADALAVDAGWVYSAGKCGLVPVMEEKYTTPCCGSEVCPTIGDSSYYVVAVVRKDSGVTWLNLRGKKSCHTGLNLSAGWNVPMCLLHKNPTDCDDFSKFFSQSCAPGADPDSTLCALCVGSGKYPGESKCKATAEERFYGLTGAFRCLVEGGGDVAFVKHTTVDEITGDNGPAWATHLRKSDYLLICPHHPNGVEVTDFEKCNLAKVPAHAVVTRPESRDKVVAILKEQQSEFGFFNPSAPFHMFQSEGYNNLLFSDSTKCLKEVSNTKGYEEYLGANYLIIMNTLRQCPNTMPDLEKACTFSSC